MAPPIDLNEINRELTEEELSAGVRAAECTGLFLRKTPSDSDFGVPGCWLGGRPTLPEAYDWPLYTALEPELTIPMHFLAQIDLAQIPIFPGRPEMPKTGTLFFFVDPVFSPVHGYRNGGCKIVYVTEDVSGAPERPVPDGLPVDLDNDDLPLMSGQYENEPTSEFRRWPFVFEVIPWFSIESRMNRFLKHELNCRLAEMMEEIGKRTDVDRAAWYPRYTGQTMNASLHQMFIAPEGLLGYYEKEGLIPPDTDLSDYIPLLRIEADSDIEFGLGYGDRAKFWIAKSDLARGDFSSVFLIGGW